MQITSIKSIIQKIKIVQKTKQLSLAWSKKVTTTIIYVVHDILMLMYYKNKSLRDSFKLQLPDPSEQSTKFGVSFIEPQA